MEFGTPTKLQYAKQLAAALGFVGLIRTDRVRIETLGQLARQRGPVLRGRRKGLWRMLEYLEGIEPGETTSLAEGVKNFCLRNAGKGIVVLITDLMDKNGYETAAAVPGVATGGCLRHPRPQPRGTRPGR